jgi:hypothetical protein
VGLKGGEANLAEKKECAKKELLEELKGWNSREKWDIDWLANYMPTNNSGDDALISLVAKEIGEDGIEKNEETTLMSLKATEIWKAHWDSWKVPAKEAV